MRVRAGKRKVFLVALTTILISGCAGPGKKWPGLSKIRKEPPAIATRLGPESPLDEILFESVRPPDSIGVAAAGFDADMKGAEGASDWTAMPIPVDVHVDHAAPVDVSATAQPVEHFVGLALAQHPSIRAARQRVAAETNRISQVRALPDPQFMNTFWPIQDQSLQTAAGRVGN